MMPFGGFPLIGASYKMGVLFTSPHAKCANDPQMSAWYWPYNGWVTVLEH